ncbi:uncharacterized protein TNCV_4497401 [Trichonephila clavipes]|nr:uncharacterized protein TNCV_4497401 [Trichonephila clavipes]
MRDKFRKETSSSKKSANGPDKISLYDSDVKGPSKYSGPIKLLFDIPHHTFTDQRTWWRFRRIRCGFSRSQCLFCVLIVPCLENWHSSYPKT